MKISCVSEKITVIELSPDEVEKYSITFKESDYTDASKRKALWQIITEAERLSGKKVKINENLEIDFMPDIKGGCLMIISENEKGEDILFPCPALLKSDNTDNILDFSKVISTFSGKYVTSLYRKGESYCILCFNADEKMLMTAFEFGFLVLLSENIFENVREFYSCVAERDALEILSGTFTKA